ncbi:MAG: hypothetical protein ACRDZQ_02935 [Acidimicrobiales bacterium]
MRVGGRVHRVDDTHVGVRAAASRVGNPAWGDRTDGPAGSAQIDTPPPEAAAVGTLLAAPEQATTVADRPRRLAIPAIRAIPAVSAVGGSLRGMRSLAWPVLAYLLARAVTLAAAAAGGIIGHQPLGALLSSWDGAWYVRVATTGYPTHIPTVFSTLGFFPLYPLAMRGLSDLAGWPALDAGLVVTGVGGLVATCLIWRLCRSWWGPEAADRAIALVCFFPGSVVFSMAYSEGLLLALVAGCLLALQARRWLAAGVLAGLATAVGPDAVVVVASCAVAAAVALARGGAWRVLRSWWALAAPVLAPAGLAGFAVYLWIHTGTPFASFDAQRQAWGEALNATSTWTRLTLLLDHPLTRLNDIASVAGSVFVVIGAVLLLRRRRPPAPAWVWALGIALLALLSTNAPPVPRFVLTSFPLVAVLGDRLRGNAYAFVLAGFASLLVATAAVTMATQALTP